VPVFGQEQSSVLIFTNLRCQQWPKKGKITPKKIQQQQYEKRDESLAMTTTSLQHVAKVQN